MAAVTVSTKGDHNMCVRGLNKGVVTPSLGSCSVWSHER